MSEHNIIEKAVEKVFEGPAIILEEGVEYILKEEEAILSKKPLKKAEEYWATLGPGLITGAADDDPSGIATYSQAGAQFGPQFLWLSLFSLPFMATVQEMCGRIGLVTGHGLAANIRRHYSRTALYIMTALLFAANTFNIGADLGAMASGVQLIAPKFNFSWLVIILGGLSAGLQIFTSYARYAKILKYLSFVLFAYVAAALMSGIDWADAIRHLLIPSFEWTSDSALLIAAILGTTISPYLFFWQSSQEVEELTLSGKEDTTVWKQEIEPGSLSAMKKDTILGMIFSNAVMFFIIAAAAGTLHAHGITEVTSAAEAAQALRPFAGDMAYFLFALGILGVGLLAIPVLAGSTSYAMAESFDFDEGLYRKLNEAHAFYGVIIISMIVGATLNFIGLDPIKALIWSSIGNAIVAPVALFFIVSLSGSKKIMGPHASSRAANWFGWLTVVLMSAVAIFSIWAMFN